MDKVNGAAAQLSLRFARLCVRVAHRDYWLTDSRPKEWRPRERPLKGKNEPTKYCSRLCRTTPLFLVWSTSASSLAQSGSLYRRFLRVAKNQNSPLRGTPGADRNRRVAQSFGRERRARRKRGVSWSGRAGIDLVGRTCAVVDRDVSVGRRRTGAGWCPSSACLGAGQTRCRRPGGLEALSSSASTRGS